MSEECERLILHNLSNLPKDPEKLKEHISNMMKEIQDLKQDLIRTVEIMEETRMSIGLEGYAWEFGIKILDLVLGC